MTGYCNDGVPDGWIFIMLMLDIVMLGVLMAGYCNDWGSDG